MIILLAVLICSGPPIVGFQEFVLEEGQSHGIGLIRWPVVAGVPEVAEGINRVLDYETVNGEPLSETIEFYRDYHCGIMGSDFAVNYMDNDYLYIELTVHFMGAYPSTITSSFLFNLENGEQVLPGDLFIPESMDELAALCDERLQENIRRKEEEDPELESVLEEHHFTTEDLCTAGILKSGIVFNYQFDFPHISLAAEPSGLILLEWNEISDYLLPGVRRN